MATADIVSCSAVIFTLLAFFTKISTKSFTLNPNMAWIEQLTILVFVVWSCLWVVLQAIWGVPAFLTI